MQPEIHIGPLELKTFGICFALAFLASGLLVSRRLSELGRPPDWAYEMVFAALIGGLVGSRVDYLLQNWDKVSDDLLGNIFSGSGLVWFGGLVGGALGVILWARWRRWLGWELFDTAAVPLAVGYALGRVGCQLSGDGDYGTPSDLPWAMAYPDGTVPTTDEVHPTPVYETLAMGLAGVVLWRLRDRVAPGMLFGLYLIFAGSRALPGRVHPPQRGRRRRAHPAAAHRPGNGRSRRGDRGHAPPRRAARGDGLSSASERGRRAEGKRHRGARGAVRVEGDLDADQASEHRHRGAAEHGSRGGARVMPHGQRRAYQHREHEQGAQALHGDGHGGGEQHEEDEPERGWAQARGRGAGGVEGDGGERPVERHERGAAEHEQERPRRGGRRRSRRAGRRTAAPPIAAGSPARAPAARRAPPGR